MLYKYRAISNNGEIIEGVFEAKNMEDVVNMLRDSNYLPIGIEEMEEKWLDIRNVVESKIKKKDIAIFCRQFYTMIDSGINIVNCLDILEKQTENKALKLGIGQVHKDVQKGMTLSEAMKKQDKIFPEFLINMIRVGEVSGTLDIIMHRMATHYEKESNIDSKIKGILIYPIILIIVTIAVVIFLLTIVMPTFISMFENSGVALPGPTRLLLSISNRIKNYWYIYIISFLLVIIGLKFYSHTKSGRLFFDTIKIKIPGIRKLNVKILTSYFTRTLSTLLSSGIPILQSLEVTSKVIDNEVIVEGIQKTIQDIKKGMAFSTTIKEIGVFPPMVDSMIKVGEESGTLDEMLLKTADFYDDEIEISLHKMTTMLEPILIIIMGFIIGFIVIAMAMPMFDMVNTITI